MVGVWSCEGESVEKPPMVTVKSNINAFIELDGEPTGEITPHTFTELSLAPHTFRVYYTPDYNELDTTLLKLYSY